MDNTCGTNSCKMNHEGDGTIPEELKEKWNEFIEKNCNSINCNRRHTTKCCVWGTFAEQQ
ncbi:MAG: hypothetical protein WA057_00360 [Candidatus Magasanikiibacteriota bacterium]